MRSGEAIKARRESAGMSLSTLADRLGVTKSYVSLIENGKRAITPEQASVLHGLLGIPAELLLVGSGRLPDDVITAIVADPAAVTTVVRSEADAGAVSFPTSPASAMQRRPSRELPAGGAIPDVIKVNKSAASFRAHSYHTKVPTAAIVPFIEAFTKPGDTVLDSFCGSGMTGVAALSAGRNAMLSDVSPAAIHIARNYTAWCDPDALEAAVGRLAGVVEPVMKWLYTPAGEPPSRVEYTTWSDVLGCPHCKAPVTYWDAFREADGETLPCPSCRRSARKADYAWLSEKPVVTHVTDLSSGRMSAHPTTEAEAFLIAEVGSAPIMQWTPDVPFGHDREMWRASHGAMGIRSASDFYTRRNLHALSQLRHAILAEVDLRLRDALLFAFTACVNRASKRYQWNAKRPTNVMTGTLYVSSLRYEWNVWSLFRRKAADAVRYYRAFPATGCRAEVCLRSATDLACLPDGSVDMVFVDPPFGSNIFYADSSLLWEAWLGCETDQSAEIVVNQRRPKSMGGKDLAAYGELMASALGEVNRVLRRGGRAVLAFSNSDDRVWASILDALSAAALDVGGVHIVDKGQPSIKGVKGQLGQEHVTRLDLALTLSHRTRAARAREPADQALIDAAIEEALQQGHTRTDQIYSCVLRRAIKSGRSVAGITMPAVERRRRKLDAMKSEPTPCAA